MRLDLWRNLLRWAIVAATIFLLYVGYALWGPDPYWTGWLALCAAACIVVGLPVALLVSLAHRRTAHRIMAEWRYYRYEGQAPERRARVSKAA